MIHPVRLDVYILHYPLEQKVKTAFGVMPDRPALFLKLTGICGTEGWGEVWCNFPAVTAEYRASILTDVLAPLVLGKEFEHPSEMYQSLKQRTKILSLQSAETGPFSSCIAGLDIAAHDLFARQNEVSVCELLGGKSGYVPIYASGMGPDHSLEIVSKMADSGYTDFKVKVGFDQASDVRNVHNILSNLGKNQRLAIDANQGWSHDQARDFISNFEPGSLAWVEEPLCVSSPEQEWVSLAESTSFPLAGGENLSSRELYQEVIDVGYLEIIQPDIAKWGGFTEGLPLAKAIQSANKQFYPHFLGGAIGLAASAHLLAAAGGGGKLEVDCNPNPLRSLPSGLFLESPALGFEIQDRPGLGIEPDFSGALSEFLSEHRSRSAT